MAWQMNPTPRDGISLKCSKSIFEVHFILYPPKFFLNIVNVSGIEIHLTLTFQYHVCINVKLLEGYLSLHIDIFLHICVCGFLRRMLYLLHTYHVSSVSFSGVQESIICVVHRNHILSDVKY